MEDRWTDGNIDLGLRQEQETESSEFEMRRATIVLTYSMEVYVLLFAALLLLRPEAAMDHFSIAIAIHAIFCAVCILLLGVYIVSAARNRNLTRLEKAGWMVGFIFAALVTFPMYWHKYMRAN